MSPFRHYWTWDGIVEGLQFLQRQLKRVPTVKDVREWSKTHPKKVPSYSTIVRAYEDTPGEESPWKKALEDAGIDTTYSRRGRRPKGYSG